MLQDFSLSHQVNAATSIRYFRRIVILLSKYNSWLDWSSSQSNSKTNKKKIKKLLSLQFETQLLQNGERCEDAVCPSACFSLHGHFKWHSIQLWLLKHAVKVLLFILSILNICVCHGDIHLKEKKDTLLTVESHLIELSCRRGMKLDLINSASVTGRSLPNLYFL